MTHSSETILKVNHAGEYDAIQIYKAQIAVHRDEAMANRWQPRLVDKFLEIAVGASTNFVIWLSHRL